MKFAHELPLASPAGVESPVYACFARREQVRPHTSSARRILGQRDNAIRRAKSFQRGDPHRLLEGAADFWRLAEAMAKALEAGFQQRIALVFRKRDALRRGGLGNV